MSVNPKIIHRIYFTNYKPFYDPFEHYLESWAREMPDYTVMKWGYENLDTDENDWTRVAAAAGSPVFLSEYFRWKLLAEYGGLYLDADCEVLDGKVLGGIVDALYQSPSYDVAFGVEEKQNGHPTAQTFAAKKDADVVSFMRSLYTDRLAPLWPWRETRGLIGPQLIALYYANRGHNKKHAGFFVDLDQPTLIDRAMVYPQHVFSPKFTILGDTIDYRAGETCVYHMFANSNVDFSEKKQQDQARNQALTFDEYRSALAKSKQFPRLYDSSHFSLAAMREDDNRLVVDNPDGLLFYGPYFSIEAGDYAAIVKMPTLPTKGRAFLAVTAEAGKVELGRTQVDLSKDTALRVPFTVPKDGATKVEITVSMTAKGRVEFTGVEIDLLVPAASPAKNKLKTLHRIYFGFDGKPDPFAAYLDTWREQLPDFEIRHWNADNLPMNINPYVRQLYAEKDHAFLTDFFRWYVLREYGGVYFDADIEVVDGARFRGLVEELEYAASYDAFIGIDEKIGGWYTAHSMASRPHSELSRFMCEIYANFGSFAAWRKKGLYFWAPQLVALYFANHGHNVEGMGTSPGLDRPIITSNVKIFPQDWFSPLAPTGDVVSPFVMSGLSDNTCICHHFACSWHSADSAYRAYSEREGGQAQVLLADIVSRKEARSYAVGDGHLRTDVGILRESAIITNRKAGRLLFGPYTDLAPGRYRITFVLEAVKRVGSVRLDVSADCGARLLGERIVDRETAPQQFALDIELTESAKEVEFRVDVSRKAQFSIKNVHIQAL